MWSLAEDVEYHAEKCQAEYGPIPFWLQIYKRVASIPSTESTVTGHYYESGETLRVLPVIADFGISKIYRRGGQTMFSKGKLTCFLRPQLSVAKK